MSSILIVLVVGIIFFFLTKGFINNPASNKIDINEKKVFKGDLASHEAGLLVALLAKVAKADGRVSELEAQLIKHTLDDISNTFENSAEVRQGLKDIYDREKEDFSNTLKIAQKYQDLTRFAYVKRKTLLGFLLNLAFIDGEFSPHEQMICEDIAKALGVKDADYKNLVSTFEKLHTNKAGQELSLKDACGILGVSENDNLSVIKKKYRSLVKRNHPDILMGQGKSEEDIKQATQNLQKINEAYELIKKLKES